MYNISSAASKFFSIKLFSLVAKFNITSLPTNYAWFDPWTKFLKLKGVEIKLNHEVKKISLQENDGESTISNIIVSDNLSQSLKKHFLRLMDLSSL